MTRALVTAYRPPPHCKRWSWVVDIDTTAAGFERLGRALVATSSHLTDSMTIGHHVFGRGVSAFLAVSIPDGQEEPFRRLCRPYRMEPPPRVSVGLDTPPDDGHPGRSR